MARNVTSLTDDIRKVTGDTAVFDIEGEAATGAVSRRFYNATGRDQRIKRVHVAAATAPTGAALVVDVKVNGDSIFGAAGDRPRVAAGQNAGLAELGLTSKSRLPIDAYVTVELTAVGSTVSGSDITVQVLFA